VGLRKPQRNIGPQNFEGAPSSHLYMNNRQ
jgi:hypothetical protein